MAIAIASLTNHWSDPDGDPVTLFLVNANSANGVNNVGTDGVDIFYTNASPAADSITYLVADVRTNPPAVYRPEDTVQTGEGRITILPPPALSAAAAADSLTMSGTGGTPAGFVTCCPRPMWPCR